MDTNIERLPRYELDRIFSNLSIRDIRSLSLVNKDFNKMSSQELQKRTKDIIDNIWIASNNNVFAIIRSNRNIEYHSGYGARILGTLKSIDNIKGFFLNERNEPFVLENSGKFFKVEGSKYYYYGETVDKVFKKEKGLYFITKEDTLELINNELGLVSKLSSIVDHNVDDYDPSYQIYDGVVYSPYDPIINELQNVRKLIKFHLNGLICYIVVYISGYAEFLHEELFDMSVYDEFESDEYLFQEEENIQQERLLEKFNFESIDLIKDAFLIKEGELKGVYFLTEDGELIKYYNQEFYEIEKSVAKTYNNDYNIIMVLEDGNISTAKRLSKFPKSIFLI